MNKQAKGGWVIPFFAVMAIAVVALVAYMALGTQQTGITGDDGKVINTNPNFNPAATYVTQDKSSSADIVTGTSYYKKDGEPASTTALSNVDPGTEYTYWVSNSSNYVKPLVFTATQGNNNKVNTEAYQNVSVSLTAYDLVGKQAYSNTTAGGNVTLAASGTANVEIDYLPTYKQANMPFGGLLTVETNSTIASVTCSYKGVALAAGTGNFHATLTPTIGTTHTVRSFVLPDKFDDGSNAAQRAIECQLTSGSSKVGEGPVVFDMIPANYYITNDGSIVLDTEKFANQDTTRTGIGGIIKLNMYLD